MKHEVYKNFLEKLEELFPQSSLFAKQEGVIRPELISPFTVSLPTAVIETVAGFCQESFKVFQSPAYRNQIIGEYPLAGSPTNYSALSCFDFHYSPDTGLKLIEINTNAALYLTLYVLRFAHDHLPTPFAGPGLLMKEFVTSYQTVLTLPIKEVLILDRNPQQEKMYFEFLMYKEWFEQHGLSAKIVSLTELNNLDIAKALIYNRFTDFYLTQLEAIKLRDAYMEGQVCLTPNPWGYYLMADKRRLSLLRQHLPVNLQGIVPETRLFAEFPSVEEIWARRKKLFFKPSNSHGGKAAFSGRSISRKKFDSLADPKFIAQELAPAGRLKFRYQEIDTEMKFDLRFFANPDGIVDGLARLYQGQTTNTKTPLGGIAPIIKG